jgi:predicted SprT family Zn-dependent metalloprotease
MNIYGQIKFQDKITIKRAACLGACETGGNHFRILISKDARQNVDIFAETILHELCHLWLSVLISMAKLKISDRRQHKIIEAIVPRALKEIAEQRKQK